MATIIDQEFAKYYNELVPMMLELLNHIGMQTIEQKTLRSKTIETMGFMIEAVAAEKQAFLPSVQAITRMFVDLLKSGLSTDDPQALAIKEALAKISSFLKEDFEPFLNEILP